METKVEKLHEKNAAKWFCYVWYLKMEKSAGIWKKPMQLRS